MGDHLILEENKLQPQPAWRAPAKSQYIYEGTDSDSDEDFCRRGKIAGSIKPTVGHFPAEGEEKPGEYPEYQLEQGELAKELESFCPFAKVMKYPETYVGKENRQKVFDRFFKEDIIYHQTWDFFYIYKSNDKHTNEQPITLVPAKQFEELLRRVNRMFGLHLIIPQGANGTFQVSFSNDGNPRPRYLGRLPSNQKMEAFKREVPPYYYKLDNEPDVIGSPDSRSLAAFKAKINLMADSQRAKKLASKEKAKLDRINRAKSWKDLIKRVQRYLGLRTQHTPRLEKIHDALNAAGVTWGDFPLAVKEAASKLPPTAVFDPDQPATYESERSVVFVCIDVEAWERNSKNITEIGIATLDTQDLVGVNPGEGGFNWMKLIRARHFRINEHKHLNNFEFVSGCADRFDFGESEFINLKDAPAWIASCFKHPFSQAGVEAVEEDPKRSIVLVGHDVGADVNFLKTIGYNVYNISSLEEEADTALMWRYLKREINPRNLGSILAELGIAGWNLHNAGNDAVYTLQAMLGIAIKHIVDKEKAKEVKVKEKRERIDEEATKSAMDREEGWSSSGENSDGGAAIEPGKAAKEARRKTLAAEDAKRRNTTAGPWDTDTKGIPMHWGASMNGAPRRENLQATSPSTTVPNSSPGNNLEETMSQTSISNGDAYTGGRGRERGRGRGRSQPPRRPQTRW